MADVKISQLPASTTPLDGTEVLPIVQSATTKQVSIANVTAGRAVSALSMTLTNALPVTSGGTGISAAAQGSLLSATGANTFSAVTTPTLGLAGTSAGTLGLSGSTSGVVTLQTAATAGTWSLTLPTSGGSNGFILTTNGSGVTSWTNPTALGVDLNVGTTAISDGTSTRVLYNNAGVLGEYAVTGTGSVVLGTTPTFTTSALFPAGTVSAPSISVSGDTNTGIYFPAADTIGFVEGGVEGMRIDSSGNLLVGTASDQDATGAKLLVVGGSTGGTSCQVAFGGVNGTSFRVFHADAGGSNAAATVTKIEKVSSNSRSINAAGTINASGADYAEYMEKSGDFTIAKGDICGIDASCKLTNVFSDAVTFVVKSTDPSYVGGDIWGVGLEGDALEAARQKVDRVAFAGQVPVNVIGATAGDYIIPENDNGSIKGVSVSNPTFEQYQKSVGRVVAIEPDGRARIIVKVA